MRLEQLSHVIEIARQRSFSRAAEKLYISQPALSVSIKNLEAELGKVLFKRTNKGIALTSDGEQICRDAESIRAMLDGWYDRRVENEPEGEVHVVSLPVLSSYLARHLVVPFQKRYPKLTVFVHNMRHYDALERLKNTNASIALSTLSLYSRLLDQLALLNWEHRLLANDERRLYIGTTHPLAEKEALCPEDLKQLALAYHSDIHDQVSKGYARYFARTYRLANKEDCFDLVMRNEAVFIQSYRLFCNDWRMQQRLVVDRPIPLPEVSSETGIYAYHSPELSEIEQLFWDFLIEEFPRHL
ncbi:MAG: LysR family transcriptional regulator [Mailhella sp.]|nr:LysR family transcriptional regulator [Mailhella sp.]